VGVRIEPPQAVLTSLDGAQTKQKFLALSLFDDGTERQLSNVLTTDQSGIGALTDDTFSASGTIGGVATLQATVSTDAGPVSVTAQVTVNLRRTTLATGVSADVSARFDAAPAVLDAARAAGLTYPLDGVVMPQNVYPVDVQWTRGAAGDLYRVTLQKPHVQLVALLSYDAMRHWQVDVDGWHALARTDANLPASLSVERIEATTGDKLTEPTRTLTFAPVALTGSVYYWETDTQRLQRIDDGSGKAVSFMPTPPVTNDPSGCVGCHSVSHSGRYLAGRLGGGNSLGTVFDLTTDLTGNPATSVWPVMDRNLEWWFSSWSPDDTRLIVSAGDKAELRLYDPMLGVRVATKGSLPLGTHPSWSPDGKLIAYVTNQTDWGFDMTKGDLALLKVTGPDAFGSADILHAASKLDGGTVDSFPTWSPDSAWLAFAHGTGSRSSQMYTSQLFMLKPDGSGVRALSRASSSTKDDFQPSFAPFQGGGYYWLTFLSRRSYGNDAEGNGARPLDKRQQIWVTAIRTDAAPGSDPSSVPFWLPGQDTQTANISAAWSPRPCRAEAQGCSVGSECCSNDCRPNQAGALVCSPPPPERCHAVYEACSSASECCSGTCTDHLCVTQTL
jgi:WD40-like Beta Propeller Repeat